MKISVCLASFNGARYIGEQIDSILPELEPSDELIIADDCSHDSTRDIIQRFNDDRITLLTSAAQQGHVASFAKAIAHASGDIIVMSDQDDIWLAGRQARIRQAFADKRCTLVAGNFQHIGAKGEQLPLPDKQLYANDSGKGLRNIGAIFLGNRPYYGCAMAFRRELTAIVLPIPALVESHDLWIAMAANLKGKAMHLEQPLLAKRSHANNVSSTTSRPWPILILSRIKFLAGLLILAWRAMWRTTNSAP